MLPWARQPPQGAAWLNLANPFAKRVQLLVCCAGSGFAVTDSISGRPGTVGGTITTKLNRGWQGVQSAGSANNQVSWAGKPTTAPTRVTLASVFVMDGSAPFPVLLNTSFGDNAGMRLGTNGATSPMVITKGGIADLASATMTAGNVSFAIASHDTVSGDVWIMIRDLVTGQITTGTGNNTSAIGTPSGTMNFSNRANGDGLSWNGSCYMAYVAYEYFPQALGYQWLYKPWCIFAPRRPALMASFTAAAGGIPRQSYYHHFAARTR